MTRRILVANGSAVVCDTLARAICNRVGSDVGVEYVHDGEAVIERLTDAEDTHYECVVLCRPLSVTNAWEALNIIRDVENGWPYLPVIIATQEPSIDGAAKAWRLGADEYLFMESDLIVGTVKRLVGAGARA